jgi:tetratricopeptide (TPR) repeat protein
MSFLLQSMRCFNKRWLLRPDAALCCGLLLALAAPVRLVGAYDQALGKRSEALKPCDEHMDRGRRAQARGCYVALIDSTSDPATQAEAYWGLNDYKRANELFRDAVKTQPENADLRVRWGYLYLTTHDQAEAANLFQEALAIDGNHVPAKLGSATVLGGRFEGKALDLVREAIEAQPDQVQGYLLLARMALEEQDHATCDKQLDIALEKTKALGVTPLDAYALKASLDHMNGKTESEWTKRALEYNPGDGRIYAEPAHFYVITRRYREAAELYRKAVEVEPTLWAAHADLAVNLLREGEVQEGQKHLEMAFSGDPYSPQTTNTLRLLDSFKNFRSFSNHDDVVLGTREQIEAALDKPQVILKLHQDEAAVLRPYAMDLAERSIEVFSQKYGFKPQRPVQIEMYPDHDDFAVRTMGMPGLGLLGVTFGYVVAMDSPSGRRPGTFHWGTTLWHEMAHVFTLEATKHLVPRWFSEGISMYEEWEYDPSWGEQISPDFLDAMKEEKLLPVADLDRGFVRPRYPNQIAISYFQAGLVCKMIDEEYGFDKLTELLKGYAEGKSTADNIQQVLDMPAEEFDKEFAEYLDGLLGEKVEALPQWREEMKRALEAFKAKKWDEVVEPAQRAIELYPDYVESGNPYTVLAEAQLERGNKAAAADLLQAYQQQGGKSPESIKQLAGLLEELGRRGEAMEALEGLLYIAPIDADLHERLGNWLLESEDLEEAAREYQTLLALNPLNQADAHYNLARTYHKMKDRDRARRHLLLALEAAPNYRPAQRLLLELTQ